MSGDGDNLRGALCISASMAGFAVNDAIMKLVFRDVPLFQAILIRGLFACVLIGTIAWWFGALRSPSQLHALRHRTVALRTLGEAGATVFFLSALVAMPLANATAVLQAVPLTITMGAALLLGERVGWRRWLAILVGLAGVLLIVQPGLGGFVAGSGYALAAVAAITLRDLVTRRMPETVPPLLVSLLTAVTITAGGAVGTVLGPSVALSGGQVAAMAFASVFMAAGYIFSVYAMRFGEVGFVTPFRYSVLLWASLLGWLVFREVPNALALVGTAVVVASGLYTFMRERSLRKAAIASA